MHYEGRREAWKGVRSWCQEKTAKEGNSVKEKVNAKMGDILIGSQIP